MDSVAALELFSAVLAGSAQTTGFISAHLSQPSPEMATQLDKVTSKRFAARMMVLTKHRGAIYPQRAPDPCDRRLETIAPRQKPDAVFLTRYAHAVRS
jgi:hypothetical protein